MKKRTFGHREFSVIPQRIRVSDISRDVTLQARQDDSPWIRGRDIANSVKNTGATAFRDNIVVAKRGDTYIVVDGFGRLEAATILGWEEIEVDVLSRSVKDNGVLFISLTANNGQVSEQGYTKSELQEAAYKLYKEIGLAYEEIAEVQDVSVEAVRQRVMRGEQIAEARAKSDNLASIKVFSGTPAAKTAAVKVVNAALKLSCDTYKELCETIRKKFGIELRMLAGNNEKMVKGLVYDLLTNEEERGPMNFLVLFYLEKVGANSSSAWNTANRILNLKRIQGVGSFHFADLSADTACFNGRDIACYVQGCRRAKD